MSFKGGVGFAVGTWVTKKGAGALGVLLMAGFIRAAAVEGMQASGDPAFPEDGRGILSNTFHYTYKNVTDAIDLVTELNAATKNSKTVNPSETYAPAVQ